MDYENREKLIKKEIMDLLVKFHKGTSIGETTKEIMGIIEEIRYVDRCKVEYVLSGLILPKIDNNNKLPEEKAYKDGFNEAAEQNNFAIDLAIKSFNSLNDEK